MTHYTRKAFELNDLIPWVLCCFHGNRSYPAMKQGLDELAAQIRKGITESGYCTLAKADLALVWEHEGDPSDAIKWMHVGNFARQYGFDTLINHDLSHVVFRNTK